MLRLLALAKKHLFPKAHAMAAIKCEGATVKNPPLEITGSCFQVRSPKPFTKQRVRASLGTKNLIQAREHRDELLFGAGRTTA